MNIVQIEAKSHAFKLLRPYQIAHQYFDEVDNAIVRLTLENGITGLGVAAPVDYLTGETMDQTMRALNSTHLACLLQQPIGCLQAHLKRLKPWLPLTPSAAAAIDIALHDAYAKHCNRPLVDVLGRVHQSLPTSITIGIKGINESIEEAHEYIGRGFKHLKLKLGENVLEDIERLHRLQEAIPSEVRIRVDMNQGYSLKDLQDFLQNTSDLSIELIEQPFLKTKNDDLAKLPLDVRASIAADESLITPSDAFNLIAKERSCGIFNIKLMKCGGIGEALQIAALADHADVDLMWGCMDESRISIAAALHTALACPKTKYLDLDGSLDLAKDVVQGGFILENGWLRTTDKPGLGVEELD